LKLLLALSDSATPAEVALVRRLGRDLAVSFNDAVTFSFVSPDVLGDLQAWISIKTNGDGLARIEPGPIGAEQHHTPIG
jgi:hypothetical protein